MGVYGRRILRKLLDVSGCCFLGVKWKLRICVFAYLRIYVIK
jgi:hypothetical protein